MTTSEPPPPPPPPASPRPPRPTRADQRGFEKLQADVLTRALDDAKAWRNGYAMLAGGLSALLGFIGTRLDNDTGALWRAALTVLLGGGLLFVGAALAMTLTIEGGRRRERLNLRDIVARHNSLQTYQALQASAALKRLDCSKTAAAIGAVLAFAGLLVTLWMPGPAEEAPTTNPAPTATSTQRPAPVSPSEIPPPPPPPPPASAP